MAKYLGMSSFVDCNQNREGGFITQSLKVFAGFLLRNIQENLGDERRF